MGFFFGVEWGCLVVVLVCVMRDVYTLDVGYYFVFFCFCFLGGVCVGGCVITVYGYLTTCYFFRGVLQGISLKTVYIRLLTPRYCVQQFASSLR